MAYGIASDYSVRALRVLISVPIRFSFLDQSSPRRLENFGEDIPTSPDVIAAHTRNFKPNFKFSPLIFWGTPVPVGDGPGSLGQCVSRVYLEMAALRNGRNVVSRKKCPFGLVTMSH